MAGGELMRVEAVPIVDERDEMLVALRAEARRLRAELLTARQATQEAEAGSQEARRALTMLRQQLTPLYRALRAVFGELEAVADIQPSDSTLAGAGDSRIAAVWESWKTKLGGQCAKVIDVLLTHGEMNTTQLAIAVGTRRQNIPNLIYKLNQAGLINKNGGRFSLKSL